MASAELVIAFGAKLDGLEASLKRVNTRFEELERSAKNTSANVEKSLNDTSTSLTGLVRNIRQAVAAFAVLQAFRLGRDLVLQMDDINQSLTRMQFLLGGSREAARQTFNSLAEISRRTGAPISDLTDQFVRFRVALNSIGATNQQVNQLVETLANFARVSGNRPQEAINAITQLGQGLASGRLGGEELRSVLENTPLLAQELARELGVSVGELRKMGEEGRLVARNVFPALLRAGERIAEQLKGIPLSVRQSFEVAKTSWTQLIAHIDEKVGASAGIAAMLRAAGLAADIVRRGTGGETDPEMLTRLNRQLAESEQRIRTVQGQLQTGIITGQVNQATGLELQPERIGQGRRRQLEAEIAEHQRRIVDMRLERQQITDRIESTEVQQTLQAAEQGRRNRESQARADNRSQIEELDRRAKLRREAAQAEQDAARISGEGQLRDAQGNAQTLAQRVTQIREKLRRDIAQIDQSESADAREAEARRERERMQAERQRAEALSLFRRADQDELRGFQDAIERFNTAAPGSRVGTPMDVMLDAIRRGNEQVSQLFGAIYSEAEKAAEALIRAGRDPKPVIDELNRTLDQTEERLRTLGVPDPDIQAARVAGFQRMQESLDKLREKSTSTWNDIASRAAKTFSSDLAGSVVDFALTAENSFDKMAANFVSNVAKMILEFLILRALILGLRAAGVTLPGFNFGPASASIEGRMAGGAVEAGTPYIVGERRPELFVPGSSGYIFPEVNGTEGAMTVNIYNNSNSQVRAHESTDSMGNRTLEVFVEEIVKKGMTAGRFDGTMRQNYNLSRPGRV